MEKSNVPTRLLWFAGLWLSGVLILGFVAFAIKSVIL